MHRQISEKHASDDAQQATEQMQELKQRNLAMRDDRDALRSMYRAGIPVCELLFAN